MKKNTQDSDNLEFENTPLEGFDEGSSSEGDNMSDEAQQATNVSDNVADQCREWQDRFLRLSAEFDNFRKRTLKEKMELVSSGGEEMAKAILPVIDDLERAQAAMEQRADIESEREGIRLIYQKFLDILKSKQIVQIDAQGEPLDVDFHDAVAKVPVEDPAQKGRVIDIVQTGYKMGDKVIRFARVVVGE